MQRLRSQLSILYRDAAITIVSKPPGLLSVPGRGLPRLAANAATLVSDWWWEAASASRLPPVPSVFRSVESLEAALEKLSPSVFVDGPARLLSAHPTLSPAQRRQMNTAGVLPYVAAAAAMQKAASGDLPPAVLPGPLQLHRLDELTSGLLFFANTLPVQRALSMQWQSRAVRKVYEAVVDTRVLEAMKLAEGGHSRAAASETTRLRAPPAFEWACRSPLLTDDEGEITTHLQPTSHEPLFSLPHFPVAGRCGSAGESSFDRSSLFTSAAGSNGDGVALLVQCALQDVLQTQLLTVKSLQANLQAVPHCEAKLVHALSTRLAALIRGSAQLGDTDIRDSSLAATLLACPQEGAKPSLTRWRVLERSPGMVRLRLEPLTGRTHQLRLHCALPPPFGLGAPIIGDHFYGDPSAVPRSFLFILLARTLERTPLDASGAEGAAAAAVTIGHLLLAAHLMREAWLPWLAQTASNASPASSNAETGELGSRAAAVLDGWKQRYLSMGLASVMQQSLPSHAVEPNRQTIAADDEDFQSFISDSCRGEGVTSIPCKAAVAAVLPMPVGAVSVAASHRPAQSNADALIAEPQAGSESISVVVMRRALLHASEVHLPDYLPHSSAYAALASDPAQMETAIKRCDKRLKEAARAAEKAATDARSKGILPLGTATETTPGVAEAEAVGQSPSAEDDNLDSQFSPFSKSAAITDGKIWLQRDSHEWQTAMATARARWPVVDVAAAAVRAFDAEAATASERDALTAAQTRPEPELTTRAYEAAVDAAGKGRPALRRIVVFRNPASF